MYVQALIRHKEQNHCIPSGMWSPLERLGKGCCCYVRVSCMEMSIFLVHDVFDFKFIGISPALASPEKEGLRQMKNSRKLVYGILSSDPTLPMCPSVHLFLVNSVC